MGSKRVTSSAQLNTIRYEPPPLLWVTTEGNQPMFRGQTAYIKSETSVERGEPGLKKPTYCVLVMSICTRSVRWPIFVVNGQSTKAGRQEERQAMGKRRTPKHTTCPLDEPPVVVWFV